MKITSSQKEVEDAGLHVLRELFNLAVGIQKLNELCALVVTDRKNKNNGKFDIDYLATMTTQTKNNKRMTNTLVAYDELDSEIIQV